MQVLGGLETVIVRRLPVRPHLMNELLALIRTLCVCNKSNALKPNVFFSCDRTVLVFN